MMWGPEHVAVVMSGQPGTHLTFAAELRRRRYEAGLSLTALSKQVNYSKSHLCKIELGAKRPTAQLARRCDQALAADGALAHLVQPRVTAALTDADTSGEVWIMKIDNEGPSEFHSLSRRNLLAGGGVATLSWVIPAPEPTGGATEVALSSFRTWFHELRTLAQTLDPASILNLLIAATNTVQALPVAEPRNRQASQRLASRFAEFTGWMAQEQGSEIGALWWTKYAVKLAAAGGDTQIPAYALVRQAELAMYRDDPKSTIEFARLAQQNDCSPRVRSLAAQREAQGLALSGDEKRCHRALDRAAELLTMDSGHSDEDPVIGSTNMADPVRFVTAWCLQDLGRSADAATILIAELARVRPEAARTRARYGARLALCLASAGEAEEACRVLEPLLDLAPSINSATVRHDLRRVNRTLGRWRTQPSVRRSMPRLADALRVPA